MKTKKQIKKLLIAMTDVRFKVKPRFECIEVFNPDRDQLNEIRNSIDNNLTRAINKNVIIFYRKEVRK